jgi:hypothetical protein
VVKLGATSSEPLRERLRRTVWGGRFDRLGPASEHVGYASDMGLDVVLSTAQS